MIADDRMLQNRSLSFAKCTSAHHPFFVFVLRGEMPFYQKWSVRQCPLGGCGAVKHGGWRSYEGEEQCRQNLLQHLEHSTYHQDPLQVCVSTQVCRDPSGQPLTRLLIFATMIAVVIS